MLLVTPAVAMVAIFVLFPLGFAVYISLTNWPLIGPYHFIGGQNYSLLVHDPEFLHSVLFTLLYTAIVTGPIFVVGYAMAVLCGPGGSARSSSARPSSCRSSSGSPPSRS
jgi:multiple sugar transport system permease protein